MMVACIIMASFFIWSDGKEFGTGNRLMMTFFIIGLASFLTWITTIIIEVKDKVVKK